MHEESNHLWERIQSLDESVKRRVMIIGTIAVMLIVVAVWVVYVNTIVIGGSAAPSEVLMTAATGTPPATTPSVSPTEGFSGGIWKGLRSGLAWWWGGIMQGIRTVTHVFDQPGTYAIQPN